MRMNHVHPHPGPLPQEREKRSASLKIFFLTVAVAAPLPFVPRSERENAQQPASSPSPITGERFSLSLGEKAGERASVHQINLGLSSRL
jgi:hypothetical protein